MRKLLLLLCLIPSFAFASNWTVVRKIDRDWCCGKPGENGKRTFLHSTMTVSVDRDSIVARGVTKEVYWKVTSEKDGYIYDSMYLERLNCQTHKTVLYRYGTRRQSNDQYHWLEAASQLSPEIADQLGSTIEPDSFDDFVFSAVCLNNWKQG